MSSWARLNVLIALLMVRAISGILSGPKMMKAKQR